MARATYEPRKFLKHPDDFGVRSDLKWLPPPASHPERSNYMAAYAQALASVWMRDNMRSKGISMKQAAGLLQVSLGTLQRKMRGEVPVSLSELYRWADVFGVDVFPNPEFEEDLLPPTDQIEDPLDAREPTEAGRQRPGSASGGR